MENEKNQETQLEEFENEKPKPKKQDPTVGILFAIFFIGYGIYRLTNTLPSDGSWNTFFGWSMIVLGIIRIGVVVMGK